MVTLVYIEYYALLEYNITTAVAKYCNIICDIKFIFKPIMRGTTFVGLKSELFII